MAEVQLFPQPYSMADNTHKSNTTKPSLLLWNFKHQSRKAPTARAHEDIHVLSLPYSTIFSYQSDFVGLAEWLLIVEFPHCSAKDKAP